MLARFATGASFSADCRGGGKESNAKFLNIMIQMARHLLDHDSSQRNNLSRSISNYLSSSETKPSTTSPATTQPLEETVQVMMVSSLLSDSYESWSHHRTTFLQRGIYHAYMQRHGRSTPQKSDSMSQPGKTSGSDELFTSVQPMLVYTGLIEQLQCYFKSRNGSVGESSLKVESEAKLEGWEIVMKERLLNV